MDMGGLLSECVLSSPLTGGHFLALSCPCIKTWLSTTKVPIMAFCLIYFDERTAPRLEVGLGTSVMAHGSRGKGGKEFVLQRARRNKTMES
jgi:hypothetical protein